MPFVRSGGQPHPDYEAVMRRLSIPSPVRFSPDGKRVFHIAVHSRRQMRLALELEAATETEPPPLEESERSAQQLAALAGCEIEEEAADGTLRRVAAAPVLLDLTPAQEARLLFALLANGTEDDPAARPQVSRSLESAEARMRSYDAGTVALAVHLGLPPELGQ